MPRELASRLPNAHKREGRHFAHDVVWPVGRVPALARAGRDQVRRVFRVEVAGTSGLQLTRMGSSIVPTRRGSWRAVYYSVEGYPLRNGMRAAVRRAGEKFRRRSR